ncbi:hypothetical protein C8R44DRAFT_748006 [Mycena epipterygia]|nr:hypothetical protein C8R44DRAFT_748006 [Mycena epipterygia]
MHPPVSPVTDLSVPEIRAELRYSTRSHHLTFTASPFQRGRLGALEHGSVLLFLTGFWGIETLLEPAGLHLVRGGDMGMYLTMVLARSKRRRGSRITFTVVHVVFPQVLAPVYDANLAAADFAEKSPRLQAEQHSRFLNSWPSFTLLFQGECETPQKVRAALAYYVRLSSSHQGVRLPMLPTSGGILKHAPVGVFHGHKDLARAAELPGKLWAKTYMNVAPRTPRSLVIGSWFYSAQRGFETNNPRGASTNLQSTNKQVPLLTSNHYHLPADGALLLPLTTYLHPATTPKCVPIFSEKIVAGGRQVPAHKWMSP